MRPDRKQRCGKKDDRFGMVAEERNIEQRHVPLTAQCQPECLHIEREIECRVTECPPLPPRESKNDDGKKCGADQNRAWRGDSGTHSNGGFTRRFEEKPWKDGAS